MTVVELMDDSLNLRTVLQALEVLWTFANKYGSE